MPTLIAGNHRGCPYEDRSKICHRAQFMKYDPEKHHRRSLHLKDYDYTQVGAYFVTIVTQRQACIFGSIEQGETRLNDAGRMVYTVWSELPAFYNRINTDVFVVMPNHFHGILIVGATPSGCPSPDQAQALASTAMSVPDVVHRFKTLTTKRYTDGVKQSGWAPFNGRLWQRNYYEHVIRDEESLNRIREYILNNPARWSFDPENPRRHRLNRRTHGEHLRATSRSPLHNRKLQGILLWT